MNLFQNDLKSKCEIKNPEIIDSINKYRNKKRKKNEEKKIIKIANKKYKVIKNEIIKNQKNKFNEVFVYPKYKGMSSNCQSCDAHVDKGWCEISKKIKSELRENFKNEKLQISFVCSNYYRDPPPKMF